ncbi:putative bifunctional diguanylate cyclase/phosphodiesterase [Halomonas icarae]|uniref:EAL domain-containing protein n=1 Tax=Halomonas icarae TaxID=2691040 RepID=A0A7X5AL57_9GAMM|nr:EAL domain-containing protein [Halomonas icarae]MDR5901112.1 EAL domain-containing protein [Halomonas icarae]NAW11388.1 EAL domain-containing protein [Halomonas icarae]
MASSKLTTDMAGDMTGSAPAVEYADRPCILVVDDDRLMRTVARLALQKEALRVVEADSGEAALSLLATHRVDLVLLDACMPGVDGFSVCRKMRTCPDHAWLPVIMVTGLEDDCSVETAFEAGVSDYVNKPIHWSVLKKRIAAMVRVARREVGASRPGELPLEVPTCLADTVLLLDPKGKVLSSERLGGLPSILSEGWRQGRVLFDALPAAMLGTARMAWQEAQETGRPGTFVMHLDTAAAPFVAEVCFLPRSGAILCLLKDRTAQWLAEQRLFEASHHDPVTGLIKDRLFRDQVAKALAQDQSQQRHTVLCRVVVDNFRQLLERFDDPGIQAICQQLVARLRVAIRLEGDGVACAARMGRLSDQEFAVLLPGVERLDDAMAWIRQAGMALDEPFQVDATPVRVSCTLGISTSAEAGEDGSALINAARVALAARTQRRDGGVVAFSSALNDEIVQRARMEALLRQDLERGSLHMNYQPKVAASDLRLLGVEALLRWNSAELGMVPPARFIPLAEEAGLMTTLSHFVIDQVLNQLKGWRELGPHALPVAINLPGSVLAQIGVVGFLQQALDTRGLSPDQLEVEVTEDVMIDRDSPVINHLRQLRTLGVRVAIDDFGTGYSSLSYLRDLPVDVLKIDRSFVCHLPGDSKAASLVRAIINVAHELGLEVVAEGVETASQLSTLNEMGCDVIQGFFTGRPMAAAQILNPAVH